MSLGSGCNWVCLVSKNGLRDVLKFRKVDFIVLRLLLYLQYHYDLCHLTHTSLHLCSPLCTTSNAMKIQTTDYNVEGSEPMIGK